MPLRQRRTLLRAVVLGVEAPDIRQEARQLFGALSSLPLLPVLGAPGGAGEVSSNDTPERLPLAIHLTGEDGEVYASIEIEADSEEHPVPVGLTLHRAVVLELHGEDEADVVLLLTRGRRGSWGRGWGEWQRLPLSQ